MTEANVRQPLYGAAARLVRDQLREEPSDLEVAISVAQQLLDSGNAAILRESLRILLRALDAEPTGQPVAVAPAVAAGLPTNEVSRHE